MRYCIAGNPICSKYEKNWDNKRVNTWENLYEYILGANATLDYIDEVSGTEIEKNYIKAQSYALRAFYYYMLVNQYGLPYNYNKESLGVPLKLDSKMRDDDNILMRRNTVEEVYRQIVTDLNEAERLFLDSLRHTTI